MKKIFRTVAALAVVAFAGCTTDFNDEVVAPSITGGTTVTVGIADTKTYLGELVDGARKVYWHNGDQIAINGNASTAITLNEEKTSAVFEFGAELTHPYSVLYPASMYKDATTITLPAIQNGATNNFAKDTAPMASYQAAEGTVQMHHLAGVIRLQVKLPAESAHTAHPLNKVETKGNAGEQMSGDFAIDYEAVTLTATSTADADKVVTTSAIKDLSAEETDDVFIVVPAREYPQGITVRLIDKAGHYMDIASKAMTIEAGEIKAMPVVEFKPTGTLVGVEITSAEELVAFANAYNANEYVDVNPLVVTLKNDIVFDDATNAAWTPIGGKFDYGDHYFNGYFDGAGFAIKNWNSTRPLFAYTNTDGVIENLTIDASCTLTANFTDEDQNYGALVGYHRGVLINCHVNANLTASGDWGNSEPHVGALVGRVVVGTVENCTVSGDVTITNTLVTNGAKSYYGGAVARISNPAGVVKGVSVSGNVSHSAGSTYIADGSANANDAYVYYGGIVGLSAGTVTDCHLTDATKKFFYGNYTYGVADSKVNNHYRTQSVGAIVGEVDEDGIVSNCTNRAEVVFNQYNGDVNGANTDISRYFNAGGVVGHTYGEVSNCTMYASITNRSSCLQQFVGGVVGKAESSAKISNCANEGEQIAAGTAGIGYYQARNGNIGGVIGNTYSTNISVLSNKSTIISSRSNSNASATMKLGGIVGLISVEGTINGNGTIVNYGEVQSTNTTGISYVAMGGIVGETAASLSNVVNEGKVNLANMAAGKNAEAAGIIGRVSAGKSITLTNCTNKGEILFAASNKPAVVYLGGIVPIANEQTALVNCTNEGTVKSTSNAATTNVYLGGIAGSTSVNLSGLTNKGTISLKAPNAVSNTLYAGGIVGTVIANATLDNLTNEGLVYMDLTAATSLADFDLCLGGIIGSDGVDAAVSVTNSTHSGVVEAKTAARKNGRSLAMGGIAGGLTNPASSLLKCTCTGVVNNLTDNNNRIDTGENAKVLRTFGGCTWQGGIVGFVEGIEGNLLSIEECTFNQTAHNPDHYRHEGYANSANRGDNGGIAGFAKYADIKNCEVTITIEGQATTDVAGLVCWLVNSNLEGCTLANSTVNTANGCTYVGGFVSSAEASTISNNVMNNVTISGVKAATTVPGILAAKADANSSFTDNQVSGTFFDAEITLTSTMIGTGTPTVTGTTLYNE